MKSISRSKTRHKTAIRGDLN